MPQIYAEAHIIGDLIFSNIIQPIQDAMILDSKSPKQILKILKLIIIDFHNIARNYI